MAPAPPGAAEAGAAGRTGSALQPFTSGQSSTACYDTPYGGTSNPGSAGVPAGGERLALGEDGVPRVPCSPMSARRIAWSGQKEEKGAKGGGSASRGARAEGRGRSRQQDQLQRCSTALQDEYCDTPPSDEKDGSDSPRRSRSRGRSTRHCQPGGRSRSRWEQRSCNHERGHSLSQPGSRGHEQSPSRRGPQSGPRADSRSPAPYSGRAQSRGRREERSTRQPDYQLARPAKRGREERRTGAPGEREGLSLPRRGEVRSIEGWAWMGRSREEERRGNSYDRGERGGSPCGAERRSPSRRRRRSRSRSPAERRQASPRGDRRRSRTRSPGHGRSRAGGPRSRSPPPRRGSSLPARRNALQADRAPFTIQQLQGKQDGSPVCSGRPDPWQLHCCATLGTMKLKLTHSLRSPTLPAPLAPAACLPWHFRGLFQAACRELALYRGLPIHTDAALLCMDHISQHQATPR